MATLQPTTTGALERRTSDHLRPLDSLHNALEAAHCRWCRLWLWILRRHLERDVPAFYPRRAGR